jgi:hypothetical protein
MVKKLQELDQKDFFVSKVDVGRLADPLYTGAVGQCVVMHGRPQCLFMSQSLLALL